MKNIIVELTHGNNCKRNNRLELLLIALLGLAVQAFWAARLEHPTYMDAYYYAANGQRLAGGHGFTELVIWQFLDEPDGLPAPSHTYWMPLPSLLAAGGYKLLGQFRGAQIPFWLLAGLLPLLSFVISRQLSGPRWQAWTAALLTASGGFYGRFFAQPSTFAPFAWAGGLCLLALVWARVRKLAAYWLLAGVMAGLAHLTRADGVLLFLVGIVVWWQEIRDWRLEINGQTISNPSTTLRTGLQSPIFKVILFVSGYSLVMGGWLARNWAVMGRPLATVGTQTIFLTTYDDLFAYGRSFDLSHLLAWGWGNILRSKLDGLWLAGQTFVAVNCLVFLTPFVLWAWVAWGRHPSKRALLRPLTWYAMALYASMSLVFTFPGGRGGLFHSSAALWPWFMALAAAGIGLAVDWAAGRLSHWQPERAKRLFAALFVGVAFVMSFAVGRLRSPDGREAMVYEEIGATLPAAAVVMVGNAPGFYYHTGLAAISVPNEPVEILLQAAGRYHVTHLILDADRPRSLDALYAGELQSPAIQLVKDFDGVKLYRVFPWRQ